MTAQKRLANSEPIPAGLTLLLQARKLIGQGWTQHADARDCEEQAVEPWSPHAVAWSLLGALVAALEAETAENEGVCGRSTRRRVCRTRRRHRPRLTRGLERPSVAHQGRRPRRARPRRSTRSRHADVGPLIPSDDRGPTPDATRAQSSDLRALQRDESPRGPPSHRRLWVSGSSVAGNTAQKTRRPKTRASMVGQLKRD